MTSKIFWMDTETTGLDCTKTSMIQLSGMIEIDGTIREEFDFLLRPIPGKEVNPDALEVNHRTLRELEDFPAPDLAITSLCRIFLKYVNKFDKHDKFVPAGFNINFDMDFLRETWRCACPGDKYGVGCYLFNAPIDVRTYIGEMVADGGLRLPNYKLTTICEHLGVSMNDNAHNAINDIKATRELMLLYLKQRRGASLCR